MYDKIHHSTEKLRHFCEREHFRGWDPYDGLESPFIQHCPIKFNRLSRLLWIQIFKKNPFNLRPLFLVKKSYNPKGLGLFLSAYCNLYKVNAKEDYLETINFLAEKLIEFKTSGYSGDCWGYNFDWQSRLEYMPKYTPTVVATSFAAYALMDAYDCTKKEKYLSSALSSTNFVIHDLNRTKKNKGFIFSYSPLDHMRVYNASLLGSRMLSRAFFYKPDAKFIELAEQSVAACASVQNADGSWLFGEDAAQNWVDSFHTAYKLESIAEYQKYSEDRTYGMTLSKGIVYYLRNFFLEDGTPKYFNNKIYPIDIHCPAQFTAVLSRLNIFSEHLELAEKVLSWTINHMQNTKSGYFYYQLNRHLSNPIPYIRWGQAWMLYGMSFYLLEMGKNEKKNYRPS